MSASVKNRSRLSLVLLLGRGVMISKCGDHNVILNAVEELLLIKILRCAQNASRILRLRLRMTPWMQN